MFSNQQDDDVFSWTTFPLKEFKFDIKQAEGVIMDHHVVVLVQDTSVHPEERDFEEGYDSDEEEPATLLAISLKDHSVQEAKIDLSPFIYQKGEYSFLKYGENQIIKYGGVSDIYSAKSMICITVESFEPFQVKYEVINDENEKRFLQTTAQIYKDCLYVYGTVKDKGNEMWSFDLKTRTWKLCEMAGEAPPESSEIFNSFLYQDNFCVHGIYDKKSWLNDHFMLNLNTMTWTKMTPKEGAARHRSTVFQGHLLTFEERIMGDEEHLACFLDLEGKDWIKFDIQGLRYLGGPMIYKNTILSLAVQSNRDLVLATMNIDSFGCSALKSAEDDGGACI